MWRCRSSRRLLSVGCISCRHEAIGGTTLTLTLPVAGDSGKLAAPTPTDAKGTQSQIRRAEDPAPGRILHAACLVSGGRRRRLNLAATWPWIEAIVRAWQRINALPDPG